MVVFSTCRALFAYDGIRLKLADSGGKTTNAWCKALMIFHGCELYSFQFIAGGLKELMTKLHPRGSLYGMCRVGTNQSLIVMILWVSLSFTFIFLVKAVLLFT